MITTEAIRARFGHQEKYSLLSRTEYAQRYDIQRIKLILSRIG
jgi:hypothetical protein